MATWRQCVETVSNWYVENVHTYQGHPTNKEHDGHFHWRECSLFGNDVHIQDDCGGLVSACLYYAGVTTTFVDQGKNCTRYFSCGSECEESQNSTMQNELRAKGFKFMAYDHSILQPFDIITHSGHTEIYCGNIDGKDKVYSWGNTNDNAHGGLPCGMDTRRFKSIWRVGENTEMSAIGAVTTNASNTAANGTVSITGALGVNSGSKHYTNATGTFSGTEWGKPIDGGDVSGLYKLTKNKGIKGVVIGTHMRQM